MTPQEFIDLARTCKDRTELLQRMGGYENTRENRIKYIAPLRREVGMTPEELTALLKNTRTTPSTSPLPSPTPV